MATVAPLGQAALLEAIRTFHSPSNVAAAAGVAADRAASDSMSMAMIVLRKFAMTFPFIPPDQGLTSARA
jgi:hypothetical protein